MCIYYLIEINKISKSFLKLPTSISNGINIITKNEIKLILKCIIFLNAQVISF